MSNKISFSSHLHSIGTFGTFKVENKIQEFKDLAKCNHLNGAYVVIVLPSPDESKKDKVLYDLKQREADVLAQYIMLNMNADLVTIITGLDQINSLVTGTEKIDYVVYLHELIASERNTIEAVLINNNVDLKYFDLN